MRQIRFSWTALVAGLLLAGLMASCSSSRRYYHKPKKRKARKMAPCDCPTFGSTSTFDNATYIFNV